MTGARAVSQRYDRLAGSFAERIDAVPADRWESESPCEGWSARDVVRHVVETQGMFLGFVGRSLPDDMPSADDDPAGAFAVARMTVQAELDDPERAGAEYDGYAGRSTFAEGVDGFLCFDLNVHGWDLACAAGLDARIDPDEVARLRREAEGFGDMLRSPGAFGPEVDAPADADEQTRLLAFLGRRAD
jgi:uncharacterized protein (TIGR03086 family)